MKKRIRRGDVQKLRYWEEVLRRWREGGQSVRGFCRAEGLRESAFYFWRRELARRGDGVDLGSGTRPRARSMAPVSPSPVRVSPRRGSTPSFLPVQVVGPGVAETAQGVEIVLERGRSVRVRAGFDRQTLADVLAVLEARPC
jgi:transposase-like protein